MTQSIVVSGNEAVAVLLQLGFVARRGMRVTILERGLHVVAVPDVSLIAPEVLTVILYEAGLSYGDFVAVLDGLPAPIATESGVRACDAPPGETDRVLARRRG